MSYTKETSTKQIQVTNYTVTCDLCGKVTQTIPCDGEVDWSDGPRPIADTTIYCKTGHGDFDGSGISKAISCHLCPDCFQSKLVPLLVGLGITLTEEENDW